jgi:hypothetical protein
LETDYWVRIHMKPVKHVVIAWRSGQSLAFGNQSAHFR